MLFVGLVLVHVVIKLVLKSEDQGWSRITGHHLCGIHTSFTEHIYIRIHKISSRVQPHEYHYNAEPF